ncbi:MAG: tripartite tricarboxylate transporter substrate-binding protein [Betaproteobacteria bacterium]
MNLKNPTNRSHVDDYFLKLIFLVFFIAAFSLLSSAQAQNYPTKPIRILTGFAPGAPGEIVMRLIGDKLFASAKQNIVIESHPGASGNIATEIVSRSAPDGYTLFVGPDTVVTVNPHIYKKLSFSPADDLVPITYLTSTTQTLVCNPSVPVSNLTEFIKISKSQSLNYASGGPGVPGHLAMELFMSMTDIKLNHIPYKGPAPAMQDVMGGSVPCGFLATPVVYPQVKSGKLKGIAVSGSVRSIIGPELPTVAEAGVVGYDATFGEILLAPKGTPSSILVAWQEEVAKAFQDPNVRKSMLMNDLPPLANTQSDALARARVESLRWAKVVDKVKLKVD